MSSKVDLKQVADEVLKGKVTIDGKTATVAKEDIEAVYAKLGKSVDEVTSAVYTNSQVLSVLGYALSDAGLSHLKEKDDVIKLEAKIAGESVKLALHHTSQFQNLSTTPPTTVTNHGQLSVSRKVTDGRSLIKAAQKHSVTNGGNLLIQG